MATEAAARPVVDGSAASAINETERWYALIMSPCQTTRPLTSSRKHLDHIRKTPGPYTDPDACAEEALEQFDKIKVL